MRVVADLHIHSPYSRATSQDMHIIKLEEYCRRKGVNLLGTGDFTHPEWLKELKNILKPYSYGIYYIGETFFILSTEVCNIFSAKKNFYEKKTYRIHNIIFAPDFESVDRINKALEKYGNLSADGRPTLSLDPRSLVYLLKEINQDIEVVPAHIWTPWFSLFGSYSGFDSVEECFKDTSDYILALETGLSSDPPMNWLLSSLDKYTLISNSDAHSPTKIGREANVFLVEDLEYKSLFEIIRNKDKRFLFTIEFYPQEGKYHYDGHRNCNLRLSPKETEIYKGICPKCNKQLTVGVLNRVYSLADREENFTPKSAIPYRYLIPLEEIISIVRAKGVNSTAVKREYLKLTSNFGSEVDILLFYPASTLQENLGEDLTEAIISMRERKVTILPGYDGVYGEIILQSSTLNKDDKKEEFILQKEKKIEQLSLF